MPALIVEVLNEDPDRDRVVKRALYERHGVPEYWVVDPRVNHQVEVFRLDGGRYGEPDVVDAAGEIGLVVLPGVRVRVVEIFR